jgi:hypothetical protein
MADFSIGKDAVFTILDDGQPMGAIKLTNFEYKQKTTLLTSKPINGAPIYREVEEGWEGSAEADRTNSILDDYFVQKEGALYAGARPLAASIMQRINELDGSVTRYRFIGVTMKLDEGGSYKSDERVTQKVSWTAAQRVRA